MIIFIWKNYDFSIVQKRRSLHELLNRTPYVSVKMVWFLLQSIVVNIRSIAVSKGINIRMDDALAKSRLNIVMSLFLECIYSIVVVHFSCRLCIMNESQANLLKTVELQN
jgi:hypothetical protein